MQPASCVAVGVLLALIFHTARGFSFSDFTGNAEADLPVGTPGLVMNDNQTPGGPRAWDWIGGLTGTVLPTGWYIYDLRYLYDADTDTAYFGVCPGHVVLRVCHKIICWGCAGHACSAVMGETWGPLTLYFRCSLHVSTLCSCRASALPQP